MPPALPSIIMEIPSTSSAVDEGISPTTCGWRIEESQKRGENGTKTAVLVDPLGGRYTREGKRWRCTAKCTTKQVIVEMQDDCIYRLKGRHDSAKCKHRHGENQDTPICPIPTAIQSQLKLILQQQEDRKSVSHKRTKV